MRQIRENRESWTEEFGKGRVYNVHAWGGPCSAAIKRTDGHAPGGGERAIALGSELSVRLEKRSAQERERERERGVAF